jgi:sugar/nucleoside kinase (ribokinase family)
VIVVVGSPIAQPAGQAIVAGGLAAEVAGRCAAAGAAVQIVGRVGEDAAGDQVLLGLAAAGIGHVAVLREPGHPTPTAVPLTDGSASPDGPALGEALLDAADLPGGESATANDGASAAPPAGLSVDAADLELALRYVPDYRVLVVAADLDPSSLDAVVAAAGWSGAHLVVLLSEGAAGTGIPDAATALLRPPTDPDGAFATMVAGYAVALDRGDEPRSAFAAAQRAGGWAAAAR